MQDCLIFRNFYSFHLDFLVLVGNFILYQSPRMVLEHLYEKGFFVVLDNFLPWSKILKESLQIIFWIQTYSEESFAQICSLVWGYLQFLENAGYHLMVRDFYALGLHFWKLFSSYDIFFQYIFHYFGEVPDFIQSDLRLAF